MCFNEEDDDDDDDEDTVMEDLYDAAISSSPSRPILLRLTTFKPTPPPTSLQRQPGPPLADDGVHPSVYETPTDDRSSGTVAGVDEGPWIPIAGLHPG